MDVSSSAPTGRWTSLQPDASGARPEIDDEVLVAFEAGDADGDVITATLLYSPDDEHWQVVATGLEPGSHVMGEVFVRLPGADRGRLRLLLSDGVRVTVASDEPIVRIANRAPSVRIEAPAGPFALPVGAAVRFLGDAFDPEDRALPREAFTWSSSIDGELGQGRELEVATLSAGTHRIDLVATDRTASPPAPRPSSSWTRRWSKSHPRPHSWRRSGGSWTPSRPARTRARATVSQPPPPDSGPSLPLVALLIVLVVSRSAAPRSGSGSHRPTPVEAPGELPRTSS